MNINHEFELLWLADDLAAPEWVAHAGLDSRP